jgi:hypothetical protein
MLPIDAPSVAKNASIKAFFPVKEIIFRLKLFFLEIRATISISEIIFAITVAKEKIKVVFSAIGNILIYGSSQDVRSAKSAKDVTPVTLSPSANSQVGYCCIPASLQVAFCVLSGFEHSISGIYLWALPNICFWLVHAGHQKAPYITAPSSSRHCANASSSDGLVEVKVRTKRAITITPKMVIQIEFSFINLFILLNLKLLNFNFNIDNNTSFIWLRKV